MNASHFLAYGIQNRSHMLSIRLSRTDSLPFTRTRYEYSAKLIGILSNSYQHADRWENRRSKKLRKCSEPTQFEHGTVGIWTQVSLALTKGSHSCTICLCRACPEEQQSQPRAYSFHKWAGEIVHQLGIWYPFLEEPYRCGWQSSPTTRGWLDTQGARFPAHQRLNSTPEKPVLSAACGP